MEHFVRESLKRNYLIWLMAFLLSLIRCHGVKTDVQKSAAPSDYKSIAMEKYHSNIKYLFNSSDSFVICLKKIKPTSQFPRDLLNFFVYDLATQEIILEETSIDGNVWWKNDHEIQVRMTPGILTTDEEYNKHLMGYIFDVKVKKKISN